MITIHFLWAILMLAANLSSGSAECPDCTKFANGALVRDPEDCGRYYLCMNGRAVQKSCGRGFYFDERFSICNFAAFVDCRIGESEATSKAPPTTCKPTTTTCKPTTTTCKPTTTTCKPTTTTCEPTTTSSKPTTISSKPTTTCKPTTTTCAPETPSTRSRTTACATTPEPCEKQEREKASPPDVLRHLSDCKTRRDGTYLLDGRHCRRYYVCRQGKTMRERCSLGQWFDSISKTCKNRDEVTSCSANRN